MGSDTTVNPTEERAPESLEGSGLTRRSFLVKMGALGIGSAVGMGALTRVAAADDLAAPATKASADHQWVFVFDLRLCDGCKKCIDGCQKMHYLPKDHEWIKVYEMENAGGGTFFMPVLCQMCTNAPCTRVCPVGATYHQADGAVVIDQNVCIGCRMCMAACPYGVRVFNWQDPPSVPASARSALPELRIPQVKGTVGKCDNCAHALRQGELPACVTSCSMEAIYVGDLTADVATNGKETVILSQFLRDNDAFRFKEELGTETRVYYIAGHGQDLGW